MAILKYKNNTDYEKISSTTMSTDNELISLENDLYFKSGDVYINTSIFTCVGGYVTSSTRDFSFNLTMPKSMARVSTLEDLGSQIKIRENGTYLCGSSASVAATAEQITNFESITFTKIDDYNLRVVIRISIPEPNGTNNSPIAIHFYPNLRFS